MPMVTTGDPKLQKYVSQCLLDNLIEISEVVRQLVKAYIGINDLVVEQIKRPLNLNMLDLLTAFRNYLFAEFTSFTVGLLFLSVRVSV